MSVPENQDPGASPGLFANLRAFWGVLVAILYTRLDLASAELEESGTYVFRLLLICIAALLAGMVTFFFLLFFLVVVFWEQREMVLGIVLAFCAVATAVLILVVRRMVVERPKFFEQTLIELRRDVEGLRRNTNPPGQAAAPKATEIKS
jgi:uncharacterized membrane protein YqjE